MIYKEWTDEDDDIFMTHSKSCVDLRMIASERKEIIQLDHFKWFARARILATHHVGAENDINSVY